MTLPLWGALEKAQDNAQTIEEGIDAAILAHENDPTAHLGTGESLEAHKTEEVIDHPAFSVLDDKMAFDRNFFDISFSSIANFDVSGAVEVQGVDTLYIPSANSSSPLHLYGGVGDMVPAEFFYYPKNPRFLTSIMVSAITSQEGYILAGYRDESEGFGFKILDNKLYGFYYNSAGSAQTTEILTLVAGTVYKLEARVTGTTQIDFLINNVVEGQFTGLSLPSTNGYGWNIPWIDFKSTTSTTRELFMRGFYWEADI